MQAGALGYVIKSAVAEELLTAIRTVSRGLPYLRPAIEKMMLKDYQARAVAPEEAEADEYGLTERQKEILKLVAEGHTSEEIGEMLHLSTKTVISHRANINKRVGTSNLAELIKLAIRLELIEV